ncbi:MAG: hypothetical protein IKM07_02240, partial [Clostridia bacterium]|nr:hypothetical protein [Clostridia bacterium]
MKLLILSDVACDLIEVLRSCGAEVTCVTLAGALHVQLACYDAYCVIAQGDTLDARVRARLEEECDKGKRIFTSALNSWRYIYSAPPVNTTRSRLICLDPTGGEGLPFAEGDLLDDESNLVIKPWVMPEGAVQLLVYQDHIVAHDHTKMSREEILADSIPGMWLLDDNTLMCSFRIHNFNRARFAPRARWQALISWIAKWLTGAEPAYLPAPVVRYGVEADLTAPESFESCRADAVERGMKWLDRFLIDEGQGGILEGMQHNVDPEGVQTMARVVRTDCSGEAAGAYRFYAYLHDNEKAAGKAANLESFCHGPMQIKGGLFDGMLRWSAEAWGVCYGD